MKITSVISGAGRRIFHAAGLLTTFLSSLPADAQIYNYYDHRTGYRVYSTVPMPPPPPPPKRAAPKDEIRPPVRESQPAFAAPPPRSVVRHPLPTHADRSVTRANSRDVHRAAPTRTEKAVVPLRRAGYTAFPRISREEQQERDAERRRIIEDELRNEEESLARALERNAASDILRFGANIGALRRELASIR